MQGRSLVIAGAVLIAVSAYPLTLMAVEIAVGILVSQRYEFDVVHDANDITLGSNSIVLRDEYYEQIFPRSQDLRMRAPVQILANGSDVSVSSEVELRPGYHDGNRYHLWLSLGILRDLRNGSEELVAVQRVAGSGSPSDRNRLAFRILFLDESGNIREDRFAYSERSWPLHRALLARRVIPFGTGYYSTVFWIWPSIFYPFLYPGLTFLLGIGFAAVGWRRHRASSAGHVVGRPE